MDNQENQDNNMQSSAQNGVVNNEVGQQIQEEEFSTLNDAPLKEASKNIKTTKHIKPWVIVLIIVNILAITGVGIAVAYNNGLIGDNEYCMCAPPPGVKACRNCDLYTAYKPIIYLYPEEKTNITVKLGYPELITTDYPSYNNGWNVTAYPNGNLETGNRNYYALYYESQNKIRFDKNEIGFVVESDKIADFLEDKLSILGLNERETEEFIIYCAETPS